MPIREGSACYVHGMKTTGPAERLAVAVSGKLFVSLSAHGGPKGAALGVWTSRFFKVRESGPPSLEKKWRSIHMLKKKPLKPICHGRAVVGEWPLADFRGQFAVGLANKRAVFGTQLGSAVPWVYSGSISRGKACPSGGRGDFGPGNPLLRRGDAEVPKTGGQVRKNRAL